LPKITKELGASSFVACRVALENVKIVVECPMALLVASS
jgi:hypothetical protein